MKNSRETPSKKYPYSFFSGKKHVCYTKTELEQKEKSQKAFAF